MKARLRKYLPNIGDLKNKYKALRIFGSTILHPDLWKLGRHTFSLGVAVGIFWCLVPIPFQMIMATLTSIVLRSNLPISLLLCWITNPVTMPPIFYVNYSVGVFLLGDSTISYDSISNIASVTDFVEVLGDLWLPLYFGSFFLSITLGFSSYMLSTIAWKLVIIRKWYNRNKRYHKRVSD